MIVPGRIWAACAALGGSACFADAPPIDDGSTSTSSTTTGSGTTMTATTTLDGSSEATSIGTVTSVDSADTSGGDSEAGTDTTGEPTGFCDMVEEQIGVAPVHCLDFDDGRVDLAGWQPMNTDPDTVEWVPPAEGAPSPPNAMRTELVGGNAMAPVAEIHGQLSSLFYPLRLQFKLDLENCVGRVALAQILYPGPETYGVRLFHGNAELAVQIEDSTGATTEQIVMLPMPWSVIEFRIDLRSAYIDLWIDHEPVLQMAAPMPPMQNPDSPYVHLGLTGDPTTPCTAWYDDVVVY